MLELTSRSTPRLRIYSAYTIPPGRLGVFPRTKSRRARFALVSHSSSPPRKLKIKETAAAAGTYFGPVDRNRAARAIDSTAVAIDQDVAAIHRTRLVEGQVHERLRVEDVLVYRRCMFQDGRLQETGERDGRTVQVCTDGTE